jgi:hypothetical protein
MTQLTGGNPVSRTARRICSFALLVPFGATLLSAAPVAAAPPPNRGGEVLGRATLSAAPTSPAVAAAVPSGFSDVAVWSGLTLPTAIAFAPGGKVFVGEKGGIVKVFDSPADPTPTQVVDLHPPGPGLLGPGPAGSGRRPGLRTAGPNFIYVLYTHDHNRSATRPAGATAVPPRPGRPPTAARSPATCPASRRPRRPA